VAGFDGCNRFSGPATTTSDTIRFGSMVSTKIACERDAAQVEQNVLNVIRGNVKYRIEANLLTLEHPGGQGLIFTARSETTGPGK
jgi:heat shock protein HslJ